MKKTDIALILYRASQNSTNEAYLYLNCLNRIKATMTKEENKELSERIANEKNNDFYKKIKSVIDDYFNLDISVNTNKKKYTYPKQLYFYFCFLYWEKERVTARQITSYVNREHASLYTGYNKIKGLLYIKDTEVVIDVKNLTELINFEIK